MSRTAELLELQFTQRAFIAYLNDLLISASHGRLEVDSRPIGDEIRRTEMRLEDLNILIARKSHEE